MCGEEEESRRGGRRRGLKERKSVDLLGVCVSESMSGCGDDAKEKWI